MTSEKLKGLQSLNEIAFEEAEEKQMLADFSFLEKEEEKLLACETDGVEAMVYVMPMTNILREDERKQPFTRESLLEGAPEHTEDSWQVPRLVK